MNEQNDEEQREQRAKDAAEQPELTPSQNEQPGPARPAGWRQTRFLRTENVCSQWAPRGVSRYSDTIIAAVVPRRRVTVRRRHPDGVMPRSTTPSG